MSSIFILWKRELKSYFSSPMAYIISGLFIFLIGVIFFNLLVGFIDNTQRLALQLGREASFLDHVIRKLFGNMNFIFVLLTPLLTMRLFAEEKRQHSIELLYTAPLSSWQIVIGKYLAVFTVVLFMISLTLIYPVMLIPSGFEDFTVLFSGYLGVIFNVLCFLAIGILASSLTENQIVAAILTVVTVMLFWLVAWFSQITDNFMLAQIYKYLSMIDHFDNFTRGTITTSDLIYHFSFIGIGLYLTKLSLDSRNW